MANDIHDPSFEAPHPDPVGHEPKVPESSHITETETTPGLLGQGASTSSGDEISVLLAETKPDPFLDEFSPKRPPESGAGPRAEGVAAGSFDAIDTRAAFTEPHPVEAPPLSPPAPPSSDLHAEEPVARTMLGSDSSLFVNPLAALGVATGPDAAPQPASFDAFPSMNLGAAPSPGVRPKPAAAKEEEGEDDEDEFEDLPPRRSSLGFMLLLSYASAVTLGLIWVLVTGRRLRESEDDGFPPVPAESRTDPGKRSGQSRKITPPPALAADHLTTLGKAMRLGELETTPLEIASGSVRLSRSFGDANAREGGNDALKLKLRLKNVSKDSIFSPLDESFLRERGRAINDSLIEASDGQQIEMYPLAVASELAIVGQEFRELKPGDSYETWLVSAPDSLGRKTSAMTWRIRLRTGVDQTDTLGVRFHDNEIKPGR